MGSFARQTFNELKYYASACRQQGVLRADADRNEQADIETYEHWSFLKWFVDNGGVPKGNDGVRIEPVKDCIILRRAKSGQGQGAGEPAREDR